MPPGDRRKACSGPDRSPALEDGRETPELAPGVYFASRFVPAAPTTEYR